MSSSNSDDEMQTSGTSPPRAAESGDDAETDEELYRRFTAVVSSWPSFPGVSNRPLHRHPKGWHISLFPMVGALVADARFAARPSDVLVATLPKSGTTWIKALLYATVHRRDQPAVAAAGHPFDSLGPHERVRFLEYQVYTRGKVQDLDGVPDPRLFATHVPFVSLPASVVAATGCNIVYVFRDPKDTLVSLWHFVNKVIAGDGQEPLSVEAAADLFCGGASPFGPYWEHALGYWRAHVARPDKVLFFRYEEMLRDPAAHVRRLAEFVGRPFGPAEEVGGAGAEAIAGLCSFERMVGLEATRRGKTELTFGEVDNSSFFRRGQAGDWANHLSPETARRIDAITEAKFKGSGLCP